MRNYKSIFVTISSVMISLMSASVSADTRNVDFRDIRAMGMGGAGLATMTGFNALIYNPALLAKSGFELELINIQANMSNDIIDLIDFLDENEDLLDNYDNITEAEQDMLLKDMDEFDNNLIGAGVFPKVGVVMKGVAVGVYATSEAEFKIDKGIFEPRLFVSAHADVVTSFGFGQQLPAGTIGFLPNNLYVGGAAKIITRYSHSFETSASDAEFGFVIDSLKENKQTGYGIDLGAHYEMIPEKLSVGIKVVDLLSSIGDDSPPMLFNVGTSYTVINNFILAADYNDIFFSRGGNIFKKFFFGGEYSAIGVLDLRLGFAQGYPSAGFGIDLNGIAFDWAIYGVEKGESPGGDADYIYSGRVRIGL